MKLEIHLYHHFVEGANHLQISQQSQHQILEVINKIMANSEEQKAQLDTVIETLKTGLTDLGGRVDSLKASLETKNENPAVDLTDEIAELNALSSSINNILPAAQAATTDNASPDSASEAQTAPLDESAVSAGLEPQGSSDDLEG